MKYDTAKLTSGDVVRAKVAVAPDLVVATLYLLLTDVLVLSVPDGAALKAVVALPVVFFLPGYALVSALYPRRAEADHRRTSTTEEGLVGGRIGWLDRGVLAVGLSVTTVATMGVGLSLAGVSLTGDWVPLMTLECVTFAGVVVGAVRRNQLPASERFEVPYWIVLDRLSAHSTRDVAIAVLLVALVASSVGGLAYALVAPPSAESYSTLAVWTETDGGAFVAGEYPEELTAGENASLVVHVENQETRRASYTVVPVVERIRQSGPSPTVLERRHLAPLHTALDPGGTANLTHTFTPQLTGQDLRLAYLLYRGAPPENRTVGTAYRHVHVWLDVSETP
jgi:uncharacterized membrane protein